jgi:hypothetical protein
MIELTEQQIEALKTLERRPPQLINPQTHETFVLLRVDEYQRLREQHYDESDAGGLIEPDRLYSIPSPDTAFTAAAALLLALEEDKGQA